MIKASSSKYLDHKPASRYSLDLFHVGYWYNIVEKQKTYMQVRPFQQRKLPDGWLSYVPQASYSSITSTSIEIWVILISTQVENAHMYDTQDVQGLTLEKPDQSE